MTLFICLVLLAIGLFWILIGFSHAVFPKRTTAWERNLYRKMRLISAKKFAKPITKRKVIWVSLQGWLFFIAGIVLLHALPLQLDYCNSNAAFPDQVIHPISLNNETNNSYTNFKTEVDQIINPLINDGKSVGISVGIICGENTAVFGYGRISLDGNVRPNGDTIYEIGSTTKVFTALLLADMAENGVVNLTDPVEKYLPPSIRVPAYNNTEITLVDLASHLSGLPRIPSNIINLNDYINLAMLKNPYANYTTQQLYAFLSTCSLESEPGTKYNYSNLGMGLLGHALSQSQKMSFEEIVVKRICNPLGMNDTRINLSPEQKVRFAKGYLGVLSVSSLCLSFPATNWDIPTLSGAGALRSTVNDLMKFLTANIDTTETSLAPSIQLTHIPRYKINSKMSIGMGWHIMGAEDNSDAIYWHNGGTGGYRSYIGFNKKYRIGVVVLSNSASSMDEAGISILKRLADFQKQRKP